MAQKTVKLQFLGMKGDNRNLALTKDLVIPNAFDGHFETDKETAEMLLLKFNVEGEEAQLVKEGDPNYSAPAPEPKAVRVDNIAELKDELLMANAKIKIKEEEIQELKADLDKAKSETVLPKDKAVAKLKEENDGLVTQNLELSEKVKALESQLAGKN